MSANVLCKFQCHSKTGEADADALRSATIQLGAVWEGTTEAQQASENAIFGKWSPYGSIMLGIMNPSAAALFQPGKRYYVTFTEAPD